MEIIENENSCPTGWELVQVVWTFLNVLFDDAAAVTEEHGLHQKSLILLALLDFSDTPQGLAHLLRSPASTISYIIKELERKEFIERQLDANDRRRWRLQRTPAGQQALNAGIAAINLAVSARLGGLQESERQTLLAALPLLARLTGTADTEPAA